jgi:hypothetical protein
LVVGKFPYLHIASTSQDTRMESYWTCLEYIGTEAQNILSIFGKTVWPHSLVVASQTSWIILLIKRWMAATGSVATR